MATRRVRIVCISDTHNQTPKLPPGDILIHAGDLTNQGAFSELQKTVDWLRRMDQFQIRVVVCGNHDITCDISFYQQYGAYYHNRTNQDPERCIALFHSDPSIVYLNHEARIVRVNFADGSYSTLKIFGSPYSPTRRLWAFGYEPENAFQLWKQIPLDADIVVTHTPAKFHRDESHSHGAAGCETLREMLWRVRPRLFVCGHIHEGYGVEVVTWDLSCPNVKFKEESVRNVHDPRPESKKQFTVDLSARARSGTLQNDGSPGNLLVTKQLVKLRGIEVDGAADNRATAETDEQLLPPVPSPPRPPFPDFEKAERPMSFIAEDTNAQRPATHGLGALGLSGRSDQEAISGREGRAETCIVNAAFMASNYPHPGGKQFHKPIVIDIDLPVEYPQPSTSA
ncbi:hypothetical protein ABEF95_014638 [Exophiala dermatitidis]